MQNAKETFWGIMSLVFLLALVHLSVAPLHPASLLLSLSGAAVVVQPKNDFFVACQCLGLLSSVHKVFQSVTWLSLACSFFFSINDALLG